MRAWRAVAMLCSLASVTHAQPVEPTKDVDKPAAVQLFEEGRALLDAGRADAACKKFELSIRKDPRAVGTLLNLALCNERQGKVATALALFIEAYDRAAEASQPEQQAAAEQHIATLRAQVPIVAIRYAAPSVDGEKLLIDDRVIARDDKELSLDPGPHNVVFTAPGRLPHEATIVTKASTRMSLELPALAVPTTSSGSNPRRLAGKISTVGGVVLLAGAGTLAIIAHQKYNAQFEGSMPHCGASPPIDGREVCDATGAAAVSDSQSLATTAGIVAGVGLVATAVGITLWLTAPSERARIVPAASSGSAGVVVVGRF